MTKSNYPDWVMKYKSKGVYVNKVGETYYLYRAHSVYVKETKKYRRVSDGYIGRVTETDGFIPVKDKIQGDILVFEYGLYFFLSSLSSDVYLSLKKNPHKDSIMSLAIMKFLNIDEYFHTGLFFIYKKTNPHLFTDDSVNSEAIRVSQMLNHFITTRIDHEDWIFLQSSLPSIHLVSANDKYYISSFPKELKNILDTYHVEVK